VRRLLFGNQHIRLDHRVRSKIDIERRDEQSEVRWAQRSEPRNKRNNGYLMPHRRCWRHDQRTINESIAIAIFRHRIKIGASKGTPVGQPLNSRLRRHVTHGRRPFVLCLKGNGHPDSPLRISCIDGSSSADGAESN
jgi:hypothetical protein